MTLLPIDQAFQPNQRRGVLQACSPNPAVDYKNETFNDNDSSKQPSSSLSLQQAQTKQVVQDICTLRRMGAVDASDNDDDASPHDFYYDSSSSSEDEGSPSSPSSPSSHGGAGWSLDDFEYIGRLGKGACAQVYAAQERQSGYRVALKVQEYHDDSMMEIDIHGGLDHPNIVGIIDYFVADTGFHPNERYFAHLPFESFTCSESDTDCSSSVASNNNNNNNKKKKYLYIILEFCNGGSLYNLGESAPNHRLPEDDQVREYFQQAMEAVAHVHGEGRIHCDVKPDNFLIHHHYHHDDDKANDTTSSLVVQLADFGMAVRKDQRKVLGGSPSYMAPEHLGAWRQPQQDNNDFDHRVDIYGLGVVLYQLLVGELPYMVVLDEERSWDSCDSLLHFMDDLRIDPSSLLEEEDDKDAVIVPPVLDLQTLKDDKDVINAFFQQTPPVFPSFLSADAMDLIQKLMEPCPDKRMTLADAKHHRWFQKKSEY